MTAHALIGLANKRKWSQSERELPDRLGGYRLEHKAQPRHCATKMEPESDHSNAHQPGAATVATDERIHALITEKEQLAADLARAKSAIKASEREVAEAQRKIQELTKEKDQLAADKTRVRTAIEIAERDLVALKSQVRELSEETARLAAAKERAQAEAESVYDMLRALEIESSFDFLKRRYFSRK